MKEDNLNPWELNKQAFKGSSTVVAGLILRVLHLLTFVPILLIVVLQDVHWKLGVALNTAICVCLTAGNLCFYHMGVVKVFPKMLDTFLLVLYASMIPVVYTQYAWLDRWMNVYHHSAIAVFMWLSILLPCWDDLVLEAVKDKLPRHLWQLPTSRRAALLAAQTWATVMTAMALLALAPVISNRGTLADPLHIVCDCALPLVLLLGAWIIRMMLINKAIAQAYAWQEQHNAESGISVPGLQQATVTAVIHATADGSGGSCRSGSNLSNSLQSSSSDPPATDNHTRGRGRLLWWLWPGKRSGHEQTGPPTTVVAVSGWTLDGPNSV